VGDISHNTDGKPVYFTGVLQDITEDKLGDIRKNDFIAMVSHELKTPLTIILAYMQLMEEKAKRDGYSFGSASLGKTIVQAKKIGSLIDGFLSVSSFEAGKIYLNEETFDMNELIAETIEDIALATPNHNITFYPGSLMLTIADRDKIGQVMSNLLSNAIKYSPEGKDIKVFLKESDDMIEVSVCDEGIGIKEMDLEKLFDRYHRIENVHTKHISGFGLGLYLSAEIIQRHKGKVWVESIEGKGSTFFFNLKHHT
jgi:signal transduction histidine kinase